MAALASGVKRKFGVSDKNDYVSDTSEELGDNSDVCQVLECIINFHDVLCYFVFICVCCVLA
jgi:hypothetical protein